VVAFPRERPPPESVRPTDDSGQEASAPRDPGGGPRRQRVSWRPSYRLALGLAYGSLLAIIVLGVCLVALLPHARAVGQYGPNIVATFVGVLITLTFVERLLTWQRRRHEAPLRTVALQRACLRLSRLAQMFLFSYKAAAVQGSPAPTELEALMAVWRVEVGHLDFRKSAGPQTGDRPWYEYAAETALDFETHLHQIIDRYLVVLGTDFPVAVENVIGDSVFEAMKFTPAVIGNHTATGIDHPINLLAIPDVANPTRDCLAEFADQVITMHRAYRRIGGEALTLVASMYRDDVGPGWGSGRVEGPVSER
jgi:hypothetical protein